jgi:hypothetical protein
MLRKTALHILRKLQQTGVADRRTLLAEVVPPRGASRTWGNSYFLPGARGNGWESSLIGRGYIKFVGCSGNRKLYTLTSRGLRALAGEELE